MHFFNCKLNKKNNVFFTLEVLTMKDLDLGFFLQMICIATNTEN